MIFFSQTKDDHVKISKSRISAAKSIKEIISDIPANCFVTFFEMTANMKGSMANAKNNSDDFNATTLQLIGFLTPGSKFYISNIDSKCPEKLKKEYSFVVTE